MTWLTRLPLLCCCSRRSYIAPLFDAKVLFRLFQTGFKHFAVKAVQNRLLFRITWQPQWRGDSYTLTHPPSPNTQRHQQWKWGNNISATDSSKPDTISAATLPVKRLVTFFWLHGFSFTFMTVHIVCCHSRHQKYEWTHWEYVINQIFWLRIAVFLIKYI